MKIPIFWLALTGILVLIILFQRSCNGGKCPIVRTVPVKSDTFYKVIDSIVYKTVQIPIGKTIEHKPVPVTIVDTVFLPEIQHVDTIAILKDYFATRNYSDTNHVESYGSIIINDAITQNKIKNRRIIYDLKFPQITNTVAIKAKNQVYIGMDVGGTATWISFGPQFTLKTASDKMYHLGASFTSENKFYFHVGTDWKIHF